LDYF
jgi:histidyl-tRNA synthetase